MNTYLIAICDNDDLYIRSCSAYNMKDAKEKFTGILFDDFSSVLDLDNYDDNYDSILDDLNENGIAVSDIYDIAEFEC